METSVVRVQNTKQVHPVCGVYMMDAYLEDVVSREGLGILAGQAGQHHTHNCEAVT